ncbi:MFS transporter [Bradyrhizobium sp. dw_411]|uniref:MFS transporter n=1 Tax=Bradyrhizobium sp. dw_411 TaxID=2720082 RepID=UPI001BCBAC87|nr:MFS transporter [Bradyrhizobium sp. dw_411]
MLQRSPDRQSESGVAVPYWRLWSACFLGFGAIGMTMQVMPAYAHEQLGANAITAGLAVTIGSLATMFSRPISGRLADQSGGRRVAMAGAILGLIGGIGHVLATNLPSLLLARLFLGAGEGALFTGSVGWILTHTEQSQRGKVAGHFGLSMWMGLASGPMLGTAILSISTYRSVWIAASIIPTIAWVLVASTRPEDRVSSVGTNVRRALFPRAAWLPGASGVFSSIGYGVIAAFLVPHFAALDFAGQNFALVVFGVAFMMTRFLGSGYADRFGGRRVLLSAFLIESIGLAGLYVTHIEWLAFISTALAAAGLSLLIPSVTTLVTEAADPRERTAALGAVTSAWDLGTAVGGPLGGLVAGTLDAGPFALGAVAALIAIAPLAINPKSQRAFVAPKEP